MVQLMMTAEVFAGRTTLDRHVASARQTPRPSSAGDDPARDEGIGASKTPATRRLIVRSISLRVLALEDQLLQRHAEGKRVSHC